MYVHSQVEGIQFPALRSMVWDPATMREFLRMRYPETLPTYESMRHPQQRENLFRVAVLHTYGGVYFHARPSGIADIAREPYWGELAVGECMMVGEAGDPCLRDILDAICREAPQWTLMAPVLSQREWLSRSSGAKMAVSVAPDRVVVLDTPSSLYDDDDARRPNTKSSVPRWVCGLVSLGLAVALYYLAFFYGGEPQPPEHAFLDV
jgi:hypothetical protein